MPSDDRTTDVLAHRGRPAREVVECRPARNERLEQTFQGLAVNLVSVPIGSDESWKLFFWAMAEPWSGKFPDCYLGSRDIWRSGQTETAISSPRTAVASSEHNATPSTPASLSGAFGQRVGCHTNSRSSSRHTAHNGTSATRLARMALSRSGISCPLISP